MSVGEKGNCNSFSQYGCWYGLMDRFSWNAFFFFFFTSHSLLNHWNHSCHCCQQQPPSCQIQYFSLGIHITPFCRSDWWNWSQTLLCMTLGISYMYLDFILSLAMPSRPSFGNFHTSPYIPPSSPELWPNISNEVFNIFLLGCLIRTSNLTSLKQNDLFSPLLA